jgi:hypothetical protein
MALTSSNLSQPANFSKVRLEGQGSLFRVTSIGGIVGISGFRCQKVTVSEPGKELVRTASLEHGKIKDMIVPYPGAYAQV